ncbi:MOSC domain-containing protein [Nocardioides sp. YIM 152588]|uniref:MOSC domain-containing protein n=1 Tax=Nocardioides sp. YIM 152588 TaxID=3158259 RepID=UPI0032E52D11
MAHLVAVNVGTPREVGFAGRTSRTAIAKEPVDGPVRAHRLGLDGDQVANTDVHGGFDQAVYAYASEDLDWWAGELGREIGPGVFGENLTTAGLDLNAAVVGTRWRVGGALMEVASVRTPCNVFKGWMGDQGYDDTQWVRRFTAALRPGPYLRVLEPGEVAADAAIEVESVPEHGITVVDLFVALNLDRARLPELAAIEDLAELPRRVMDDYLARG